MTWAEFNTLVRVHLHVHNRRQGVQTLIDTLIQAAVLDIQASVPELRARDTTFFQSADLAVEGESNTGSLPVSRKVLRAYARNVDDLSETDDFVFADYRDVDKQITGDVPQSPRLFTYDPVAGSFRITPKLSDDNSELVIIHEGNSVAFTQNTEVPFDAVAAEAVASYVLTKLAMDIDRDVQLAQAHRQLYSVGKRKVLANLRETQLPPLRA